MPGSVTFTESASAPVIPPELDFGVCVIGASTKTPLAAGALSPLYSSPAQMVSDYGLGDAVDCVLQAITVTPGNSAPPGVCFYKTAATTPGVRGTLVTTGVTGAAVPTLSATTPVGTYEIVGQCLVGGTTGTAGIIIQFSVDNGRTFLPSQALGTGLTIAPTIAGISTGCQFAFTTAQALAAGDTWTESKTTPPMWSDADLYAAGPPVIGAFPVIAQSDNQFGLIVISEPVASADLATIVSGLNYGLSQGRLWTLLCRFRDPTSAETDAAYITAFQTFASAAAAVDPYNRIYCVAGSGRLTDAFRGYVYQRSGLPAVLARLQANSVIPGARGERLAQHPGYVNRGPLENFQLVDKASKALVGHDEKVLGGIDANGITFYRIPNPNVTPGAYVSEALGLCGPGITTSCLTLMDRRLANGIESVASAFAWLEIQGADVWDPSTLIADGDIIVAMQTKIAGAIKARYANEFQNPEDPNLVAINSPVTVNGSKVTFSGTVNCRFYGYTDAITIAFNGSR